MTPTSRRERTTRRILAAATAGLVLLSCAWWWRAVVASRPLPSLDEAAALAERGDLAEAAARVRAHLEVEPESGPARLLLGQILLREPDPPPPGPEAGRRPSEIAERALEQLERVRPTSPRMKVALELARGAAFDRMLLMDRAEAAWKAAIEADPAAPEAGFHLLNLYYLQWREEESRSLALRLFATEPDPHDRALLLLALVRLDARPPAAASLLKWLEPVVMHHPGDLRSLIALGLALVRAGQVDEGIERLRQAVAAHPDSLEARDALLQGLDESRQLDLLAEELKRIPEAVAGSPRLDKHRARAIAGGRWEEVVALYLRAREAEPYNRALEYRLSRALRHVGRDAEADRIEARLRLRDVGIQELRPLYDRATTLPDLGRRPDPELFRQIAEVRERMQYPREAGAWYSLVLQAKPDDPAAGEAVERLKKEPGPW